VAGRITVSAGVAPVVVAAGLDVYSDSGLSVPVVLPRAVPAGGSLLLWCADGTVTPTVMTPAGQTLSASPALCGPGRPINLGPFSYTAAYTAV
jgi:hypothetical protein